MLPLHYPASKWWSDGDSNSGPGGANAELSQLSYRPKKDSPERDSNA